MEINRSKFSQMDNKTFKNYIPSNTEEAKYYDAYKRVKRMKGFFSHALVFVVINIMIAIGNYQDLKVGESYFQWHNFTTLTFWGLGLLAHGLSVFLPNLILGNNWEDKKVQELMDKNKNNRWE